MAKFSISKVAMLVLLVLATGVLGYLARTGLPDQPAPTTTGTSTLARWSDDTVARVNGHAITESYVFTRMAEADLAEQVEIRSQRDAFIDSLITEELLLQSMLATDFEGEPGLRDRVKSLVAEHLITTRIGERIKVSDEAIRAYYDANQSVIRGENVEVAVIVLGEREDCEALRDELSPGGTPASASAFASAAARESIDRESAARGGVVGKIMNHSGVLGYEVEVFGMREGELGIFESENGCHLVRAGERVTPAVPPLSIVEPRIRSFLRRQQEVQLLRDLIAGLESSIVVERGN